MNVLDLFSGIGGFSLGLERAGFRTAAFCEIDAYCRKVLTWHWPGVPIHDDVRQLDGRRYAGAVDLVCGGYPCQPFSQAGRQQGEADARHLWPEMRRIIREARPRWVVAENVRGHVSLGFDTVTSQLEADGFTVWPFIVPASAVGAPHRRDRLWIVAHAGGPGRQQDAGGTLTDEGEDAGRRADADHQPQRDGEGGGTRNVANANGEGELQPGRGLGEVGGWSGDGGQDVADAQRVRCGGKPNGASGHRGDGQATGREEGPDRPEHSGEVLADADELHGQRRSARPGRRLWGQGDASQEHDGSRGETDGIMPTQSRMGGGSDGLPSGLDFAERWADRSWEAGIPRVATGVPNRVQRLKALGNSVVPQIPELIGRAIIAYTNSE